MSGSDGIKWRLILVVAVAIIFSSFGHAQLVDDENPIILLSNDSSFHFQTLDLLEAAIAGGADIGPVLGAAKNITPGDFDSWTQVFWSRANHTKAQAEDPEIAYDPVNVRDTWFSVASYFRRADFYLHGNPDDPLIDYFWEEQTAAFDKALAALPIPGQRVQIPADNFTVEAIWYAAPASLSDDDNNNNTTRPTIILGNGYDGAQEDLYHAFVVPALTRGWNAITYEGPGQPTVRRTQNLGFIPDWERVVTPVVDHLLTNLSSTVDPTRLALFGFSFGGYLAARAAAFEPRLSALLLSGGVWSAYDAFTTPLPPSALTLLESDNVTAFDAAFLPLLQIPDTPTEIRWGAQQGLWSFNTRSVYEFFQLAKACDVSGFIDCIKIPTWVADGTYEGFFVGQSLEVARAIGDRATYRLFDGPSGYHCQTGSYQDLNRVMWAWLNKTLG